MTDWQGWRQTGWQECKDMRGGEGLGAGDWGGSVVVVLGVVDRLLWRDLSPSLAGAPQLPCDLARTHLRRVGGRGGGGSGDEGGGERKAWSQRKQKEKERKGGGIWFMSDWLVHWSLIDLWGSKEKKNQSLSHFGVSQFVSLSRKDEDVQWLGSKYLEDVLHLHHQYSIYMIKH